MSEDVLPKQNTFFRKRLIWIVSLFLFICPSSVFAAFGISPSNQQIVDILSGTVITQQVMLTRSQPEYNDVVHVVISGPQSSAIIGPSEFMLPAGENQVPYFFEIVTTDLPVHTDLLATISFLLSPTIPNPTTVGFAYELSSDIRFRITDQEIDKLLVKQVAFRSKDNGNVDLSSFILNQGNIPSRPTNVIVTISDQTTHQTAEVIEISEQDIPFVSAFDQETIVTTIVPTVSSGNYIIQADFFKNSEQIFSSPTSSLQVGITDTRSSSRPLNKPLWIVVVLSVILGLYGIVWLR